MQGGRRAHVWCSAEVSSPSACVSAATAMLSEGRRSLRESER